MSLYADLGVDEDATPDEIKRAHRHKARQHHPDSPTGNRESFERIQRAYMVLSDVGRRRRYDATGDIDDEADNRLSRLGAHVIAAFEAATKQAGDRFEQRDLIADAKLLMKARTAEIRKQRTEFAAESAKQDRLLSRLRFSGKGIDPLRSMLHQRIASANEAVIRCDDEIEEVEAAARLLDAYGFEFSRPQPAPAAGGFTFMSTNLFT